MPDEDGRIVVPEGPGLGVEIDWDVIRRFGKRIFHGTRSSVGRYVLFDRGLKGALYLKGEKDAVVKARESIDFDMPAPPF
jgi:hypothetical protein